MTDLPLHGTKIDTEKTETKLCSIKSIVCQSSHLHGQCNFSILLTPLQARVTQRKQTPKDLTGLMLKRNSTLFLKTKLNLLIMQTHNTVAWLSHSQVTAQNLRKSRNEPGNNESKLQEAAAWN